MRSHGGCDCAAGNSKSQISIWAGLPAKANFGIPAPVATRSLVVHWPFHNRKVKGASMEELGKILPRVLKKHVRGERAPVLAAVTGVWPEAAGKAIAEQAHPLAFSAGNLTLAVACPTWAAELKGLREEIRSAINQALGRPVVRQVRVRLVSSDARPDPSANGHQKAARAMTWSEAELPAIAELDPELREVVGRSFAKYFARTDRKAN